MGKILQVTVPEKAVSTAEMQKCGGSNSKKAGNNVDIRRLYYKITAPITNTAFSTLYKTHVLAKIDILDTLQKWRLLSCKNISITIYVVFL